MLKKLCPWLFLLISSISLPVLADDDIAALVVDPGSTVCGLISTDINIPGLIDVSVCPKK